MTSIELINEELKRQAELLEIYRIKKKLDRDLHTLKKENNQ